jgi:predicted AlkP superfamily pyrophosphatase or phosphodiesterase
VIHISVDGLHSEHLQQVIDAGDAPTFKRLQTEAAWTLNARTDYTHTITLPNHTCMLTGRPVRPPEGMENPPFHGYTSNNEPRRGATVHNFPRGPRAYVTSVFDVVHDAGKTTAMYASKKKFILYDQSYDENTGAEHERGRDKIDVSFLSEGPAPDYCTLLNEKLIADLAEKRFNYVFLHYRDCDVVGHAEGWGGGPYRQAIRNIDGYLAALLQFLETDPEFEGKTAVILSADHGGFAKDHQDPTSPEDYTIPFFVWGAGVTAGDLYAMNSETRANPGADRPDYLAPLQPIRNGDGATWPSRSSAWAPFRARSSMRSRI